MAHGEGAVDTELFARPARELVPEPLHMMMAIFGPDAELQVLCGRPAKRKNKTQKPTVRLSNLHC